MKQLGIAVCAICLPLVAQAECTGQGCYDGLGLLIGIALFALVVVAGLVIAFVVLLIRKKWTAAKVVAAALGIIALFVLSFSV